MFLHLGQETLLNSKEMIGVFDLDTTTVSKDTRAYLANAEKAGQVVNVSMELPKSFVVAAGNAQKREKGERVTESKVYISQLSSATLKGRYEAYRL